jgi:hypothetical protein
VRVLNPIERQEKSSPGGVWRGREKVLELQQTALAQEGDHTLVHFRADVPGKLLARLGGYADAG